MIDKLLTIIQTPTFCAFKKWDCLKKRSISIRIDSGACSFGPGAALFIGQPLFSGGAWRAGFSAGFRGGGCRADEDNQSLDRVLAVALLRAEALRRDSKYTVLPHSFSCKSLQPAFNVFPYRFGGEHIEPKLDGRGHLVHVLTARARTPNEVALHLTFVECDVVGYMNHFTIQC